jgi:hypothetical protein
MQIVSNKGDIGASYNRTSRTNLLNIRKIGGSIVPNQYRYLVREDLKFPATSFARSKYSTKFTTNNRSACIVDQYPISNQSRSTGQRTISF